MNEETEVHVSDRNPWQIPYFKIAARPSRVTWRLIEPLAGGRFRPYRLCQKWCRNFANVIFSNEMTAAIKSASAFGEHRSAGKLPGTRGGFVRAFGRSWVDPSAHASPFWCQHHRARRKYRIFARRPNMRHWWSARRHGLWTGGFRSLRRRRRAVDLQQEAPQAHEEEVQAEVDGRRRRRRQQGQWYFQVQG